MAPNLFIIAGPNGAGKSLFSNSLVSSVSEIFDGDKYISQLKQKYPETGSNALQDYVNENIFKDAKEKAIKANESFAFETNFSSHDPTRSLREFKIAGYKTHLLFIGMNSIEECIQRVSLRVQLGGHKVPEDSIAFNFVHGFANLYRHYHEFDTVTLFYNPIALGDLDTFPTKILTIENGQIEIHKPQYPEWVEAFLK